MAVLCIGYYLWQRSHWKIGFDAAKPGIAEERVIALMGNSRRITDGSEIAEPGIKKSQGQTTPGCVRELWYHEFFLPSAYAFCFDSNSRLINKYHWASW